MRFSTQSCVCEAGPSCHVGVSVFRRNMFIKSILFNVGSFSSPEVSQLGTDYSFERMTLCFAQYCTMVSSIFDFYSIDTCSIHYSCSNKQKCLQTKCLTISCKKRLSVLRSTVLYLPDWRHSASFLRISIHFYSGFSE